MKNKVKKLNGQIIDDLRQVCQNQRIFNFAQDYLRSAKCWKYMVDHKSSFEVKEAKQCLIAYKNNRDRLMPYCKDAVEIVDKYFPITIGEVQSRPDTQLAKMMGAKLEDIKK